MTSFGDCVCGSPAGGTLPDIVVFMQNHMIASGSTEAVMERFSETARVARVTLSPPGSQLGPVPAICGLLSLIYSGRVSLKSELKN